MPIELTELASLDPAAVQAELAIVVEMLQEDNPTLDLRRGVLYDLLAYYHASLTSLERTNLTRYLSARSLLQVQADPSLADPDILADILSNWQLTAIAGSAATGQITIELSSAVSVTVGAGTVFTASGRTFTANSAFTAKTNPALVNSATDRLLILLADGNWAFTVDVTATAAGSTFLIKKNALAVPANLPLDYVTSYATDDFTGGSDPQTSDQLLNQLLEGLSVKVPSNRITMGGMLQQQFPTVTSQSIIGAYEGEMMRDKHSIVPMATGGKCDWYVRTQLQSQQVTFTKTATLLILSSEGYGTWQTEILATDLPGFFEVVSVLPTGSTVTGTLAMTVIPGFDLSAADEFIPDIINNTEAAFSKYQTAVVQFVDTLTSQAGLSPGATAQYAVTLQGIPLIDQIQDFVGSFDRRPYGTDLLVRAPIPCFVDIGFTISKSRTQADPDIPAITAAVSSAVNSIDFVGRLYASQLQAVIQSLLPAGMSAGAISMFGRIKCADGINRYIRDSNVLVVPLIQSIMLSGRTVQFFTDPSRIAVGINTDIPVPV